MKYSKLNRKEDYKITASSRIGGIENQGWWLDWKGEEWSDDIRKDNKHFDTLEDAQSIVDRCAKEFDEFVSLTVDRTIYDEDWEIMDESCVYEISGTKYDES